VSQTDVRAGLGILFRDILLVFLAALLPGLDISLFGWMYVFLPLLVFYFLNRHGWFVGNRVVLCGTVLAVLVGTLLQSVAMMVFSLTLLSTGYTLTHSGFRGDSPAWAGLKASIALALCWVVLLLGWTVTSGSSPYTVMIASFDASINEAMQYYRQTDSITGETQLVIETTLAQMEVILPIIIPSILLSCVLFTTWLTMVMGNRLVLRFCSRQVWPHFQLWHLPERFIWLGIVAALLAFIPIADLRILSINLLILIGVIYSFQGLAIFVYFMQKWNVSILFRSFLYVLVFFQSIGTILLLFFGVADVWLDFRKLRNPPEQEKNSTVS
jgi:uncharacterized protein YybS (DUF2232 family)